MTDRPRRRAVVASAMAWALATGARADGRSPALAPVIPLRASDALSVLAEAPEARATWLDFWASWCTPCKLSFPWLNEMHDRYAAQGLRIVAVGLDRREADAQRFLAQMAPRFAVALDPAATSATAMAVQAMPSAYLIGADRRIRHAHRGFRLEDRAALEQQLRNALA